MTDDRERDEESGRFSAEYPDEAFIEALEEHQPAGTGEVADIVNCHHKSAYHRLQQLEKEGVVNSKEVGRTLIWTLVD